MTEPIRVSPEEARRKNREDSALLVCAYEDEKRFSQMRLKGAISLNEFRSQLLSLAKDREIIFYCAWPQEASAAGQATKYMNEGFQNIKVLGGGVTAWKNAGYPMEESS